MALCKYLIEGTKINDKGIPLPLCRYERLKPCPYGRIKTDNMTFPDACKTGKFPVCLAKGIIPDLETKAEEKDGN